MTWRERLIARILLILAQMFAANNPALQQELKTLATHIIVHKGDAEIGR